jgi:ferric-dicitrate binding protein FerR (iron transport regulator)
MRLKGKYYKRLVFKFLQGEATPAEQRIVEQWMEQQTANKKFVESQKGLLLLTEPKQVNYDVDKAWGKLQQRIAATGESNNATNAESTVYRKRIFQIASISGIAAMLLLAIGWFGLLNNAVNEAGKTMLQVASNQTVVHDALLPDGTLVTVNTRSILNYPEQFDNDIREVSIFGEAFFEVHADALRPFVIHTSGLDIKVMGTSFNVKAYAGTGFVEVAVSTGRVLVYPSGIHPERGMMLHAGETATYSQTSGKLHKGVVDDLNFLSWKTGVLTFRETRLADVFKALEDKYETTFTIDNPDVLNERLTARFESETLDQVLETLALIFELKLESGDAEIIVH